MAAGIATPPVEGRLGALVLGKDQSWGSGAFQAGVLGGDPTLYPQSTNIPIPTVFMKRTATASLVRRDTDMQLKRNATASLVRRP